MSRYLRQFFTLLLLLGGALSSAHAKAAPSIRRVAVVVGANGAAPGRQRLRFAQEDARQMARVLQQVSGFASADVDLLLDPEPREVLAKLDARLAQLQRSSGETLLLFYYSGHADAQALYPGGKPLEYEQLRPKLESSAARVRLGIVDTCRGGGWTGTRGFKEAPPFQVDLPFELMNEGSVLIASSSGLEDAHESQDIRGGFFTHHWLAAMRGAADRNGDGTVTLTETFEYAKRATIRDTALRASTPQHPSFRMNLRGRQDLPLARPATARSLIEVEQVKGPLQLVHLDTGLVMLQLDPGQRTLKLAVPPGRYLVRTASGAPRRGKEVVVRAGATTPVREAQLELVGEPALAARSAEPRPITHSTLPDGAWAIGAALGVRHGTQGAGLTLSQGEGDLASIFFLGHGFTDRLSWVAPLSFAYRFGPAGALEWLPWGGLLGFGMGYSTVEGTVVNGTVGAGLDARFYLSPRSSLDFGLGGFSGFAYSGAAGGEGLGTWAYRASLGYQHTLADTVTLTLALQLHQRLLASGELAKTAEERRPVLELGGVQTRALRPLPLVQVHLSDVASLDGYAGLGYDFARERFEETYLLGASFVW